MRKNLKLIACKALYREISLITANCENFVDVTYLRQGFHDTPQILNAKLQQCIDAVDSGDDSFSFKPRFGRDFDAILLGYGLCSNALIGLSSKKYPLIIPKCDDCIALFLGSYGDYLEYFKAHSGTYWFNASWIENAYVPSPENDEAMLCEYIELYGEENARYVLDIENSMGNYERFTYIEWDRLKFPNYEEYTKRSAEHYGFTFDKYQGKETFLQDFLAGNWDDKFLTVPPGAKVIPNYDGQVIGFE